MLHRSSTHRKAIINICNTKKKKKEKLALYIFLHLIPKIQEFVEITRRSFSGSFIFNSSSFNYIVK